MLLTTDQALALGVLVAFMGCLLVPLIAGIAQLLNRPTPLNRKKENK